MTADSKPTLSEKVQGWRAAAARERDCLRSEALKSPAELLAEASELAELFGSLLKPEDPTRRREVEEARRLWTKLRQSMARSRGPNAA